MKLTICIPTHHGRAGFLKQLISSALRQFPLRDGDELQFCISDNASNDGTAEMIAKYQQSGNVKCKYFRFPTDMRGVINTTNVIQMAETEYCWLMGSDDVLLPGGLRRVLDALRENPTAAGMTVNKLNFNRSLQTLLGPDGAVVLPKDPTRSRVFASWREAVAELGLDFGYMSSHVFRREAWCSIVEKFGIDYLKTLRHFSHTFMFCEMTKAGGLWYWLANYCVVQRHGNSCVAEEHNHNEALRLFEEAEDYEKVWTAVLGAGASQTLEFRYLTRRLYLAAWNPFRIRDFMCGSNLTEQNLQAIKEISVRLFGHVALFWLLSYPLFYMPKPVARLLRPKLFIRALTGRTRSASPEFQPEDSHPDPQPMNWEAFQLSAAGAMDDLRPRSISSALLRMIFSAKD